MKNKLFLSESEKRRILNMHETFKSNEKSRLMNEGPEANALYNTKHDQNWDYAKLNDKYFTKRKTSENWIDLQNPTKKGALKAIMNLKGGFPETTWNGKGNPLDVKVAEANPESSDPNSLKIEKMPIIPLNQLKVDQKPINTELKGQPTIDDLPSRKDVRQDYRQKERDARQAERQKERDARQAERQQNRDERQAERQQNRDERQSYRNRINAIRDERKMNRQEDRDCIQKFNQFIDQKDKLQKRDYDNFVRILNSTPCCKVLDKQKIIDNKLETILKTC